MKKSLLILILFLSFTGAAKADIAILGTTFVNHNYTMVRPDSFPGVGTQSDVRVEVQNFTTSIPINSIHLFVTFLNTQFLQPDFVVSVPAGWQLSDSTVVGNETTFRFTNTSVLPAFFNYVFFVRASASGESSGVFNALNINMQYVSGPGSGWAIFPTSLAGIIETAEVGDEPLPVELIEFNVKTINQVAQLSWITAVEKFNYGFYIEKSINGKDWNEIDFVQSKAIEGFSDIVLDYDYTDHDLNEGTNLYRLRQVDFDGTISYSDIRQVIFTNRIPQDLKMYPNPAVHSVNITANAIQGVRIVDINGRSVQYKVLNRTNHSLNIDVSSLSAGIYSVVISSGNNKTVHQKLTVVR